MRSRTEVARALTATTTTTAEIPDFFARKRAEEELRRLYDRLKELDALKTDFFANVSHELRTPLMLIAGPVEKLLNDGLTVEQRRSLEVVQRNARVLAKQVDELLDVAKLEAGRMEARYAATDLAELVRVVARNFQELAKERDVTLTVEVPAQVVADVDVEKIGRVVVNLLSNALKFARCAVRVTLRTRADRAILEVSDDGPGVPPDMRAAVFERFRQVEGAPAGRHFAGTGLGLAIARDFVGLHHGTIEVGDALDGGGALVTVDLPITAPAGVVVDTSPVRAFVPVFASRPPKVAVPPQSTKPAPADAPCVLIVEDNADMQDFVVDVFAGEFRVATASDGREGVDKATELTPDLIVTDVMMPGLSGDELVREVRSRRSLDDTAILVLTARADDDLRVRLLGEGAQDYLAKPFSANELRARARNLVAVKKARESARAAEVLQREEQRRLLHEQGVRLAAEEAVRVRDDFVAIAGHELKTPLAAMLMQVQSLQRHLTSGGQERLAERLDKIARSGLRMEVLINQLLDVSRITAGRLYLDPESFDLVDLLRDIVERFADASSRANSPITTTTSGPLGGSWDRQRIDLVITNLISNAIKYGGGEPIEIEAGMEAGVVVVRVIDHGIGIDDAHQQKIFQRFERAVAAREFGGFGLGLWIAQHVAEASGGSLEVRSQPGRGSTFTLRLPLQHEERPHASP
jgi:signal transduction histidine kinase